MDTNKILYTVNKIKSIPKKKTFCIVSSLGTKFEMTVSDDQFERIDIAEGEVIDDAHFLQIRDEMLFDNARRQAFNIIEHGENNKKSLVMKLIKRGFSYELSEKIADYMENRGYIDEKKQLNLLCDFYLKKKYGRIRIVSEMIKKGYKREDVTEFAQNEFCNIDFASNCAYIIEHKFFPLPKTTEELKKMMGVLMRYGYTVSDIKQAVKQCTEKEE